MNWKKILLIGAGWGLGTVLGLATAVGGYLWIHSRPKPPKPWDTTAILSSQDAPGFSPDDKSIRFTYTTRNATNYDYIIESEAPIRITLRHADGSFSEPLPDEVAKLRRPVFIPSKQKGDITFSLFFGNDLPQKKSNETDDQYHERIREFCETELRDDGFALFDERNRYQINLPKIRTTKP